MYGSSKCGFMRREIDNVIMHPHQNVQSVQMANVVTHLPMLQT